MHKIKWLIKSYMALNKISSLRELADITGIKYTTLMTHLSCPSQLRVYELKALDDALHFEEEDLLCMIREAAA
ncbi:MAG: hypothetical protein IKE94_10985 [Aeriscardovia sp.]|nr:hypothetical protein [Aeriscardovia sp.]